MYRGELTPGGVAFIILHCFLALQNYLHDFNADVITQHVYKNLPPIISLPSYLPLPLYCNTLRTIVHKDKKLKILNDTAILMEV